MSTLKTNNIQHVDRSDPSIIINTDGSVNIAGTMTYEDVTNVDAVGIITGRSNIDAQKQVHVGTGVSVKAGGINVTAGITTVQALQATSGTFSADSTINSVSIGKGANSASGNTVLGETALDASVSWPRTCSSIAPVNYYYFLLHQMAHSSPFASSLMGATSVKNDLYKAASGEKNDWEKHVPEPVAEIINKNWKIVEEFATSEDKTMRVLGMKFPSEGYN